MHIFGFGHIDIYTITINTWSILVIIMYLTMEIKENDCQRVHRAGLTGDYQNME